MSGEAHFDRCCTQMITHRKISAHLAEPNRKTSPSMSMTSSIAGMTIENKMTKNAPILDPVFQSKWARPFVVSVQTGWPASGSTTFLCPNQIESKSNVSDGFILPWNFETRKKREKRQTRTKILKPCHASHTFAAVLGAANRKKLVPSDHRIGDVKCTVQAKRLNDVKHLLTITKYQAHNVPTFHLIVSLKNLQIAAFQDATDADAMYAHMFSMVWWLVLHARCCK